MHDVWYALSITGERFPATVSISQPQTAELYRCANVVSGSLLVMISDDLLSAKGASTEVKVLLATRFGNLKLSLRSVLERPLRAL
jgi:hypothetical protein